MLSKNFLLFQYNDWRQNLKTLDLELSRGGGEQPIQLERVRKAKRWLAHYAEQLRINYGIVPQA